MSNVSSEDKPQKTSIDTKKELASPKKDLKFLTKKRNLNFFQHNYLLRRILNPSVSASKGKDEVRTDKETYEKYSNIYYLLMALDWKSEQVVKKKILQNLRANSLWFYYSSTYFPFLSNEFITHKELIHDIIDKYILERYTQKSIIKKHHPLAKKEKLMNHLRSLLENSTFAKENSKNSKDNEISDLIKEYEERLGLLQKTMHQYIVDHVDGKPFLTDNYDCNATVRENLKMDTESHSKIRDDFLKYLKVRNYNVTKDLEPDDEVCCVCNDGDYEDDNLIVYCSSCSIGVHQKCYGIPIVPKEDWICHSCRAFGDPKKSEKIECILCSKLGGAMKPCLLSKKSTLYKTISTLRANYNKSHAMDVEKEEDEKKVAKSLPEKKNFFITTEETNNNNSNGNNMFSSPGGDDSVKFEKIAHENAWVHVSCALWIPDVIFKDYENKEKIQIKGDIFTRKNANNHCELCLTDCFGPTVQCEKCLKRFHVECARRNKYQLEMTDNQIGETKFHIFCDKDAPLKFLKVRELKRQRECDDIKQFGDILEKSIEYYNKHCKESLSVYNRTKGDKNIREDCAAKADLNLKEKKKFVHAVRALYNEIISLNSIEISKKDYSLKEITPKEEKYSYINILNPGKFLWYYLKEKEPYLEGMRPYEIYLLFKELVPNEEEYKKMFHKQYQSKTKKLFDGNNKSLKYHPSGNVIIIEKSRLVTNYCYCRKNDGGFMIACDGGENCKNGGWYHPECVPELKDYTYDSLEQPAFQYTCPECRKSTDPPPNFNLLVKKNPEGNDNLKLSIAL